MRVFAVADNKAEPANNSLTRNGAFHLNNPNELVNSEGKFLLGYEVNSDTNTVSSYEPKSMQIDDVLVSQRHQKPWIFRLTCQIKKPCQRINRLTLTIKILIAAQPRLLFMIH